MATSSANWSARSSTWNTAVITGQKKACGTSSRNILRPVNSGLLNRRVRCWFPILSKDLYLPEYVYKKLRPATQKQYRDVWNYYLKPRMGKLTLATFRTVHGEQMLAQIAAQSKLGQFLPSPHQSIPLRAPSNRRNASGFSTALTRHGCFDPPGTRGGRGHLRLQPSGD